MTEHLRSLTLGAHLRAEDSGRVTAILSTGQPARDGAIIEPRGWVLDNYRRNPVVLYAHQDGAGALPVGRTLAIEATDSALIAAAQLDLQDPFAVRLLGKIRAGLINATSVRWLPLKTERRQVNGRDVLVFLRQELLEWSFVAVPSDPGAVIVRAATGAAVCVDEFCPLATAGHSAVRTSTAFDAEVRALTATVRGLTVSLQASNQRDGELAEIAARTGRSTESVRRALGDHVAASR